MNNSGRISTNSVCSTKGTPLAAAPLSNGIAIVIA